MKKHIIAISGYARTGKDTLANGLVIELSRRGVLALKFKFATTLKRAVGRAVSEVGLAFDTETEDDALKAKVRPLFVTFAQFCRGMEPAVFAKATVANIDRHFRIGTDVAVISDMRYRNEMEILRDYCNEHGVAYLHIDIHRRGVYAAHQEELDSLEALLEAAYMGPWFRGVEFSDRDVSGINMYAAGVADDIANGLEVRQ
ncbi:MAG: hypothetical protein ACK5VI_04340 [Opitutia bacterium]|jgi:hypothetical protein